MAERAVNPGQEFQIPLPKIGILSPEEFRAALPQELRRCAEYIPKHEHTYELELSYLKRLKMLKLVESLSRDAPPPSE